jgi:FecR-like protein
MISKTWSRKSIAACVAVAVMTVYSVVAPASHAKAISGELSVSGQVMVNGQKVISGGTIFSDSVIVTAADSSATVSIGKYGRIELLPNTSLRLSFNEKSIAGLLDAGRARVSTPVGVSVNITTKNGSVIVDGSQATAIVVKAESGRTSVSTEAGRGELRSGTTVQQIAAGESGTAGTPAPQTPDEEHGLSTGALAALILAVAGASLAIIYAARHNNDLNFGGNVTVISPSS